MKNDPLKKLIINDKLSYANGYEAGFQEAMRQVSSVIEQLKEVKQPTQLFAKVRRKAKSPIKEGKE